VASAEHGFPADRFRGRGIVICAGGARMVTNAWVAVSVLRRVVGCTLPISVWHLGPRELGPVEVSLLATLDVEVVDALAFGRGHPETGGVRNLGGWELKAFALAHCRFEQVLLLDADNVVVHDPVRLFDRPEFAETGALVWPDIQRLGAGSPIWELCGIEYRDEPAWETGQLLIDKRRCWPALVTALHMTRHSETFFPHTHGDKDAFHLAWRLVGRGWSMAPHPARATTTGLFQRDFDGQLLFQHRTGAKWRLTGANVLAKEFRHQGACLGFLDELRSRWSGQISSLSQPTANEIRAEAEIAKTGWYELRVPGEATRRLELLTGNRIGIGADRDRLLGWSVRDGRIRLDGIAEELKVSLRPEADRWTDGIHELVPTPDAGRDVLGLAATEVIEQYAAGAVSADDAVITLATLSAAGDLEAAFDRARSRWVHHPPALTIVERARRRAGVRDPSINLPATPGYDRLD
jgi:hypothetical protein